METDFFQYWPVGLYLLILSIVFIIGYSIKKFEMDSEPLTKQTLFWLSIIVPIFSFLYFGSFAWKGYVLKIDADGFKKFIEVSALPLGLLSLSIPFTSVVNNIHRTIQTNKQIKEAVTKNNSDLFYSHQNNFINFAKNSMSYEIDYNLKLYTYVYIPDSKDNLLSFYAKSEIKLLDYYGLYNLVFGNNSAINYNTNPSYSIFNKLALLLNKLDLLLKRKKNLDRFILYKTNGYRFMFLISKYIDKMLETLKIVNINSLELVITKKINDDVLISYNEYFLHRKKNTNYISVTSNIESKNIKLTTNILSDIMLRNIIKSIFRSINLINSFIGMPHLEIKKFSSIFDYLNNINITIFDQFGTTRSISCSGCSKEEITLSIR